MALLLSCGFKTYAQDEGFFSIYENPEHDYIPSCIIETNDGGFILAAYDDSRSPSILYKLSERGEILKRAILEIGDHNACVVLDRIYQDASLHKQYCAIGCIHYLSEQVSKPFVLHFDDDLNFTETHVVDLPGDFRQFIMERAILASDGEFLFATSLGQQNGFHRLYMKIATDGTLLSFHEATEDCSSGRMINAIFEFPDGGYYGDYRSASTGLGGFSLQLFGFGEDFVFDTIGEFLEIRDTTYSVLPGTLANGTALAFGENSLLFADRAGEFYGPGSQHDNSTLLTMTDLEGNLCKHMVIGSMNDTADYPIVFNAIDYKEPSANETHQNEVFYAGCFGTNNGWYPINRPNHLTIAQIDSEFEICWKKTFTHHSKYLLPTYLLATDDGGLIVAGAAFKNDHYDLFALKINSDGMLDCDEIVAEDIRPYDFWPNPAKGILNLQYSPDITPTRIELYDLQGRLVRRQTTALECINMEGLAAGTYMMRVTLQGGKVFSDKVVKE